MEGTDLVPDVEVVDQGVASGCAGAIVRHQRYVGKTVYVGHGGQSEMLIQARSGVGWPRPGD